MNAVASLGADLVTFVDSRLLHFTNEPICIYISYRTDTLPPFWQVLDSEIASLPGTGGPVLIEDDFLVTSTRLEFYQVVGQGQ